MADTALALHLPPGMAARVLRRRSTGALLVLDTTREIGAGGEARVLEVPGEPSLVAKLYRDPTLARARKLGLMLERPPALDPGAAVAWPVDLLTGPSGGRFAGFLMPRAEGPRLFEFYNPVSRRRTAPLADYALLHRAGVNLAAAFAGLHAHGYVVGDVNESNILVSPVDAGVTLVDADSFQVRDAIARSVHRSGVGKAEFTPPELQGAHFADVDRGELHDRFGLAVLLFLLLMEGTHPFAGRLGDGGEVPPVEERISRGLFPYAPAQVECRPPRLAPPFFALDPALQELFARAFVTGHADPAARPSPAEWRGALAQAQARLATCAANPRHRHAPHLDFCPWCHRARLLQGRDPFPATVDLARAHDLVPPPRRAYPVSAQPFVPPATAAPAAAAQPYAPVAPPLPSPAAQWVRRHAAAMRAALPAWVQPAFGPAALGSPIVWMPPAALTCLFGAAGGVRMLGLVVFFVALRSVFRGGLPRLRVVTAFWVAMLLVVWAMVAGVVGGGGPAYGDQPVAGSMPGVPDPPADLLPTFEVEGDADGAVMVPPAVTNPQEVAEWTRAAYPADLREQGIRGLVRLRLLVRADGTTDASSATIRSSSDTRFDSGARRVAEEMRFTPARMRGRPLPRWVDVTIRFEP